MPRINLIVERVGVLLRHLSWNIVKNDFNQETSIAHAFCNFIDCLVDISPAISKRTFLYLDMIPQSSIKV